MRRFVLVLMAAVLPLKNAAATIPEDLQRGLELYHLAQGEGFRVLLDSDFTSPEGELNKANAYLNFNLVDDAKRIFTALSENTDGSIAIRAQKGLADVLYSQNEWVAAEKAYRALLNQYEKDERSQIGYRIIDCMIRQGRSDEAAKQAAKLPEGIWAGYAYYNLGVSYIGESVDPAKSLVAFRVADALNDKKTPGSLFLQDEINFTAGYLSLNSGDADRALTFLDKVRTKQYSTPKALYMRGVAQSQKGDYRNAIQSWYRVKKFPLIQEGVSEAFLAMPYAYEKSGYISKAASSLLEATSVFEKEVITTDKIVKTVKDIGFLNAFFRHSELDDLEWFLSDSVVTNTPKVAYLNAFMEVPGVFEQVRLLKEIDQLETYLKVRRGDIKVFLISTQSYLSSERKVQSRNLLQQHQLKLERLKLRLNDLDARLERSISEQNYQDVIAGDLSWKRTRLDELEVEISQEKDPTKKAALVKTFEQSTHSLDRDLEALFNRNIRLTKTSINEARAELLGEIERIKMIASQLEPLQERVRETASLLRAKQNKVGVLIEKISNIRQSLDGEIKADVIEWLNQRQQFYRVQKEKSEQALAHMYEQIALQQLEVQTKQQEAKDVR